MHDLNSLYSMVITEFIFREREENEAEAYV